MESLLDPATHKWLKDCIWGCKYGKVDSRAWVKHEHGVFKVYLWCELNDYSNTWHQVAVYNTKEEATQAAEIYVITGQDTATWTYDTPHAIIEELGFSDADNT